MKLSFEDRLRLLTPLDRDVHLDEVAQNLILAARLNGLYFKRRNTRPLKGLSGKKKRTVRGQNRYAINKQRELINRARSRISSGTYSHVPRESVEKDLLTSRYKDSPLLDGLVADRSNRWLPFSRRIRTRKSRMVDVGQFSFVDAPRRTMNALAEIAKAETDCLSVSMDFHQDQCMDVGPWLLLAVMRHDMAPVFKGAFMTPSLEKVIYELRLDETIGILINRTWPSPPPDVWAFPVRTKSIERQSVDQDRLLRPQTIEVVGSDMVREIDRWLAQCTEGQHLNSNGQGLMAKIIGETLDNAERHSRPDLGEGLHGGWMVSGFMAQREDEEKNQYFRCHLAFLSVGCSISDSIRDCPKPIRQEMNAYVERHVRRLRRHKNAESHLQTIYALQDGVTRDARAFDEDRSGSGFGCILHFFKDLAGYDGKDGNSTLSIVSGNTCVRIPHHLVPEIPPILGKTRNLWLNTENSQDIPPSDDCLIELEHRLNGTLITMAFNLDPEYLRRTANAPG